MTQADIWQYLLAGGRLRPKWWPENSFIYFHNGYVCNNIGQKMEMWGFGRPNDYLILDRQADNVKAK